MVAAAVLAFYLGGAVSTACLLGGYLTAEGAWGEDGGYWLRAAFGVLAGGLLWPVLIGAALVSELRRHRGRS